MSVEIEFFFLLSCFHSNPIDDILLRSIFNSNKTHSKMYIFTFDHSFGGGTFVHDINFCDDTNCSNTFWINLSSHLETIGCCHISVSWKCTKNDSS